MYTLHDGALYPQHQYPKKEEEKQLHVAVKPMIQEEKQ
jgi:hypothetical protein